MRQTGMTGKMSQTQGSGDETDTDRKGVTGHRAVEMKLTQTGMTGKVSQDTDTGQRR